MALIGSFPSLSELLAWPIEHLTEAADHWQSVGGLCYRVASRVWQDSLLVDWQGKAADKLRTGTHADMMTTSAVADQLHEAAKVARGGASDLYAARSRVRYAVEDARAAGFEVGQDLSVTDRSGSGSLADRAVRQAQAQTLAGDIRQRGAQLVSLDQQVAGNITTAVAGIRDTFPQSQIPIAPPKDTHNRVQAVDHTWKQDPLPPLPGPGTEPAWKNLPSPRTAQDVQDALQQLRRGLNKPNREFDTPEEIQDFYDWLTRNTLGDSPPVGFPRKVLEDGTEISLRPDSQSGGPTIDIKFPGAKGGPKVHLPMAPFVNDPPQLPPIGAHPPAPLPPLPTSHAPPVVLPPPQVIDPWVLPPWLQNPSPPGFVVTPGQPPLIAPWDQPAAPPAPVPTPPPVSIPGPTPSGPAPSIIPPGAEEGLGLEGLAGVGAAILGGIGEIGKWLVHPLSP